MVLRIRSKPETSLRWPVLPTPGDLGRAECGRWPGQLAIGRIPRSRYHHHCYRSRLGPHGMIVP